MSSAAISTPVYRNDRATIGQSVRLSVIKDLRIFIDETWEAGAALKRSITRVNLKLHDTIGCTAKTALR